jgi:hypothetical protein
MKNKTRSLVELDENIEKPRAGLGVIRSHHAELVSEVKAFLSALEQEPLKVYASPAVQGTLQVALESPEARYFYSASLAEKLTLDAVGNHLDEYRAALELVESKRKSLIEQGEDDLAVSVVLTEEVGYPPFSLR